MTNFPTRRGWADEEIYREYHLGARQRAQALGYDLQEFWLRDDAMTPTRASQILVGRGITGLLLAPQPAPSAVLELEWSRARRCTWLVPISIAA